MRYFLDTEFIESGCHKPLQLISIGIVAEDGRELYHISADFNPDDANDWVKENVLVHLDGPEEVWLPRWANDGIALNILDFIGEDKSPEFWGYYADYDWVVFCQLFGTMMDLPKHFPMYCCDIKQLCDEAGTLPVQTSTEHNALHDARWNKVAWEFLTSRLTVSTAP